MTCRYYPQVLAERFSEHHFREDTAAMTQMPILITLPPKNDAPSPRYNDSSHHARGRRSGPPRCCVSRSLGGVGCRGPRPFARRQRLTRTSTRLRGDQLLTSHGHPRVGPESNDHHLPPQPTVHLDVAVLSRRFNDCSRNIGVVFTVPSPLHNTHHRGRIGHGAPLRCSRSLRAS